MVQALIYSPTPKSAPPISAPNPSVPFESWRGFLLSGPLPVRLLILPLQRVGQMVRAEPLRQLFLIQRLDLI
jgi:hypothetical protein